MAIAERVEAHTIYTKMDQFLFTEPKRFSERAPRQKQILLALAKRDGEGKPLYTHIADRKLIEDVYADMLNEITPEERSRKMRSLIISARQNLDNYVLKLIRISRGEKIPQAQDLANEVRQSHPTLIGATNKQLIEFLKRPNPNRKKFNSSHVEVEMEIIRPFENIKHEKNASKRGQRSRKIGLALARLNDDGSPFFTDVTDMALRREVYDDLGRPGSTRDVVVCLDGLLRRFTNLANGEDDESAEEILNEIRNSNPKLTGATVRAIIKLLDREDTNEISAHEVVSDLTEFSIKKIQTHPDIKPDINSSLLDIPIYAPPVVRADESRLMERHFFSPDSTYPKSSARTGLDLPNWPKEDLTQPEKIAYALMLASGKNRRFNSLQNAVEHLYARDITHDTNGNKLSPMQVDQKIIDLTQGAQNVLNNFFIGEVEKYREYYERKDLADDKNAPEIIRRYFLWIRLQYKIPPSVDDVIGILKGCSQKKAEDLLKRLA